ncbi:MAG TPA: hypothetical protein VKY57_05805 [Chitinispirillaceae bacterium]|nr:hypothetical protein [Chitinispirillaceae bacterium]
MQLIFTPSAGKKLIGKAVAQQLFNSKARNDGTVAIIAGTTNGFVADELLKLLKQNEGFSPNHFFRGITTPPSIKTTESGRLPDESGFQGDVIIKNGIWEKGKTIFDVVEQMGKNDIIVKGANAVDIINQKAGILIGHPQGGTIVASLQAIVGKRTRLIIPVGLEKRVPQNIDLTAQILNSPECTGPRFLPVQGEIVTELEAIRILYDVKAHLTAAGGVCGAEGSVWIHIDAPAEKIDFIKKDLETILCEKPFKIIPM